MNMKRNSFLMLAALLCVLLLAACGGKPSAEPQAAPGIYKGESVPELILAALGSDAPFDPMSFRPANYSWSWPKGNGEYGGVEACGIGPTDPMVAELRDPILLEEAIRVKLIWPNFQAHSVTVVSWDTAVFDLPADADASRQDSFLRDAELTEEADTGERALVLEPNRVYDVYACWQEVNGSSFGNAHYYVVTKGDAVRRFDSTDRRYTGEDPWGNPLSVTLKGMDGDAVSFVYEAVIGEGEYARTFLAEPAGALSGGVIPFHVKATAKEYDAMYLDYRGSLALGEDCLFVTYDAGSVVEESSEAGSAGYQALALEGEDKTVRLSAAPQGSEGGDPTPAELVDRLFASGDIRLTLHLANDGAYNTYPAGEWYSGRFKVLLGGYTWTELEMPSTEPSEYWLTAASGDGTIKMTFWSNRGAGMLQYSDGTAGRFWAAAPAEAVLESIAKDVRMEYDNLDVDFSRISFPMDGSAEDAADHFVRTAFGAHMMALEPGSMYGLSDYEVVHWEVKETGEKGDGVVGSFQYAFVPWDMDSPGIWAGNTAEGSGDYEGKLICYREFVLQRQEDGLWHCTGLGTGGYSLPE